MKTYSQRKDELPPFDYDAEHLAKKNFAKEEQALLDNTPMTKQDRENAERLLKQKIRQWESPECVTHSNNLTRIFNEWYADLRAEYTHIPDKIWSVIYSQAYENRHGEGYDSVTFDVYELIQFLERIEEAKKP